MILIVGVGSIGRRYLCNLLALGVIGEYLARVYFRTMHKPVYVIREKVVHNER